MLLKFFAILFVFSKSSIFAQDQNSCGIPGKPSGFIVNGVASQRGAWPWIASLHEAKGNKFLCGGTLVAPTMVLTVSSK